MKTSWHTTSLHPALDYKKNSFFVCTVRIWNCLPDKAVRTSTPESFTINCLWDTPPTLAKGTHIMLKVKCLCTCYSTTYTIVESWQTALHNLVSGSVFAWTTDTRGTLWSIAHDDSKQIHQRCSTTDIPPPQSATLGLHPAAHELLLISRPTEGRRLS